MARGLGARERATTPNTISAGLFRYQTDPDAAPATSGSKQPQDDRRQSLYADRMDNRMTAIERAFQLARSGRASTVAAIDRALKHEGYGARQIEGPALRPPTCGTNQSHILNPVKKTEGLRSGLSCSQW
jgi:hypothetical protein